MNALPNYLQKDIQQYLAASVLNGLDLFQYLPPSIIGQIALKLKSKSCNVGHQLFESGDIGKSLYIQRTGRSKLYIGDSGNYRILKRGQVCGENVILSRERVNTLRCETWSEFYVLDIDQIIGVLLDNFDAATAKREWNRIKSIVRGTELQAMSSSASSASSAAQTRRVEFGSIYFKERYVAMCCVMLCCDAMFESKVNKKFSL